MLMNPNETTQVQDGEVHASFLAMDGIANHKKITSDAVVWMVPEFEQHAKSFGWFAILGLVVAVISVIIYLFTRDWMSPIFVIGLAALAWYYAHRKPEDRSLSLDLEGLDMGKNFYPLSSFKSFAVDSTSGVIPSIVLYPLRRFMPPLTLNCPTDKLAAILNLLATSLPVEAHNPTRFDLMMSKIKF
jgi:hypothetical protein